MVMINLWNMYHSQNSSVMVNVYHCIMYVDVKFMISRVRFMVVLFLVEVDRQASIVNLKFSFSK